MKAPRGKGKPNPPGPRDVPKGPKPRKPLARTGKRTVTVGTAGGPLPNLIHTHDAKGIYPNCPACGTGLPPARVRLADRTRRPQETPAESLRGRVWVADQGHCVACRKSLPREAGTWVWQVHHPIPQQTLIASGLSYFCGDVRAGVLVCKRCHERHENVIPRIPSERLPARVHELAAFLGPRFIDLLDRLHPQTRSRP